MHRTYLPKGSQTFVAGVSGGRYIATGLGFHLACKVKFWSAGATEGCPAHSTSRLMRSTCAH